MRKMRVTFVVEYSWSQGIEEFFQWLGKSMPFRDDRSDGSRLVSFSVVENDGGNSGVPKGRE